MAGSSALRARFPRGPTDRASARLLASPAPRRRGFGRGRAGADLVPLLRTCTHGQRIRIDTALGADLWPAMVEASQVEAAVLNLALNARDAMPDGGVLTIATSNTVVAKRYR